MEIKICFALFTAAVCLIQVDWGGVFLSAAFLGKYILKLPLFYATMSCRIIPLTVRKEYFDTEYIILTQKNRYKKGDF